MQPSRVLPLCPTRGLATGALTVLVLAACLALPAWSFAASLFDPIKVDGVLLSPEGGMAAVVRGDALEVVDVSGDGRRTLPLKMFKDLSCAWSGSEELVCTGDAAKGRTRAVFIDARKGVPVREIDLPGDGAAVLAPMPDEPGRALVRVRPPASGVYDVYALEPENAARLVERNPGRVVRWLADTGGGHLASVGVEPSGRVLACKFGPDGTWRKVRRWAEFDSFNPLAVESDGTVLALDRDGGDTLAVCRLDPVSGACAETVGRFSDWDADTAVLGPDGRAAAVAGSGARLEHVFADPNLKRTMAGLRADNPDDDVHIADIAEGGRVLVQLAGPAEPGRYLAVDPASGRIAEVARVLPGLDRKFPIRAETVSFKASDGLSLTGLLVLPGTARKTGLPLVALVHDGPFGQRDHWRFDPLAASLASAGAAVLRVNMRGSGGFGAAFERAGHGRVGGAVAGDVALAMESLVRSGLADPERLAAAGRGFGGYVALWLAVSRTGLLACAGGIDAPLNLLTAFEEVPVLWRRGRERLALLLGDPGKDFATLVETSPAFFPEKAGCPVFLAVDPGLHPARAREGRRFAKVLNERGVDAELVEFDSAKPGSDPRPELFDFLSARLGLARTQVR